MQFVAEDGTHPPDELEPSPQVRSIVVLAGRATRVPEAADTRGMQRSITVTGKSPLTCHGHFWCLEQPTWILRRAGR
jgi:hypothetical protein